MASPSGELVMVNESETDFEYNDNMLYKKLTGHKRLSAVCTLT